MTAPELYVEPPQLTVSIYSIQPEVETFAYVCDVVAAMEGVSLGLFEVAPPEVDFDSPSDLAGIRHVVEGCADPAMRVIGAGFKVKKYGLIAVEYWTRTNLDRHPIGATLSAGALGWPSELQSKQQRSESRRMAVWLLELMGRMALAPGVLYGSIAVETSMPTPARLRDANDMPTTLYFSQELLDAGLESAIRDIYGASGGQVNSWPQGIFATDWQPFASKDMDPKSSGSVRKPISQALSRSIVEWRRSKGLP